MNKVNFIDIYYGIVVEFYELFYLNSSLTSEIFDKSIEFFYEIFNEKFENGQRIVINGMKFDVDTTIPDDGIPFGAKSRANIEFPRPSLVLGTYPLRINKDPYNLSMTRDDLDTMDKARFTFEAEQREKLPEQLREKPGMFYFLPRRY